MIKENKSFIWVEEGKLAYGKHGICIVMLKTVCIYDNCKR